MTDAEAAAVYSVTGMRPDLVALEARVIAFCERLGQFAGVWKQGQLAGFVAWFRVAREHAALVAHGQFEAVQALPVEELTGGPVLVVADAAGIRIAPRLVAAVKRLAGVEEVVAFRKGHMRRHRVNVCRGS